MLKVASHVLYRAVGCGGRCPVFSSTALNDRPCVMSSFYTSHHPVALKFSKADPPAL